MLIFIHIIICVSFLFSDINQEFETNFNKAKEKFLEGDYKAAEELVKQALLLKPDAEAAIQFYLDLKKSNLIYSEMKKSAGIKRDAEIITKPIQPAEEKTDDNLMSKLRRILEEEKEGKTQQLKSGRITDIQTMPQKVSEQAIITEQKVLRKANYIDPDKNQNNLYEIRYIPYKDRSEIRIIAEEKFDYLETKFTKPPMIVIDMPEVVNSLPKQKLIIKRGKIKSIRHSQFMSLPVLTSRVVVDLLSSKVDYKIRFERENELVIIIANEEGVKLEEAYLKIEPDRQKESVQTQLLKLEETIKGPYIKLITHKTIIKRADEELVVPIVIQVFDKNNKMSEFTPVVFKIDENKKTIVSDNYGIIELKNFNLPVKKGNYKLEISLAERPDIKNFIDIKIEPGSPEKIIKISGDNQKVYLNKEIEKPLVVKVVDKYNNLVPNTKVYFSLAKGEGIIDVNADNDIDNEIIATTNEEGIAECKFFRAGLEKGFNIIKASILINETIENVKNLILTTSTNISGAMNELMNYIKEPSSDVRLVVIETKEKVDFKKLKSDLFSELTSSGNITEFPQYNSLFVSDEVTNLNNIYNILENYQGFEVESKTLRSVNFTVEVIARLISIDFVNANLSDVLRTLAELGNWNISYPDLEAAQPVNVHLVDVPALMALDIILENQGFTRVQEGNVIKIIPKEEAKSRGMTTTAGNNYQDMPEGNAYITQVIPLKYVSGADISLALEPLRSADGIITFEKSSNSLIVTDNTLNIKRFLKIINEFERTAKESKMGEQIYLKIYKLKYEKPSALKEKLENLLKDIETKRITSTGSSGPVKTAESEEEGITKKSKKKTKEKKSGATEVSFEDLQSLVMVAHDDKGLLIVYATEGNHKNIEEIIKVVDNPIEATIKVFDKTTDLQGQDPTILKDVLMELRSAAANQSKDGRYIPVGGIYTYEYFSDGVTIKKAYIKEGDEDPRKYVMVATANKLAIIGEPSALKEFTRIVEDISKENIELAALKEPLNELRIYNFKYIKATDAQNYIQSIERIGFPFSKIVINEKGEESIYIIAAQEIHNKIERVLQKIDIKELKNVSLYSMIYVFEREKDLKGYDPLTIAQIIYEMKNLRENQDEQGNFIPVGGIVEVEYKLAEGDGTSKDKIRSQRTITKDPRKYTLISSSDKLAIIAEPDVLRNLVRLVQDLISAGIDIEKLRSPINVLEVYDIKYVDPEDFVNYVKNIENVIFPFSKNVTVGNEKKIFIIADENVHLKIKRILKAIDRKELKGISLYANVNVLDRVTDLNNNNPERLKDIIMTMPNLNANKNKDGEYVEPGKKVREYDDKGRLIGEKLVDPRQYQLIASNEQLIIIAPPEPMREITKMINDIIVANIDLEQLRIPLKEFRTFTLKHLKALQVINYLTKVENKVYDFISDNGQPEGKIITVIGTKETIIESEKIIKKIDVPEFIQINFTDDMFVETIKFINKDVKEIEALCDKKTPDAPIGSLLSSNGSIFIDYQSNSLIVNDKQVNIARIKEICKNYDVKDEMIDEVIMLKNTEVASMKSLVDASGFLGKMLSINGKISYSLALNALLIRDYKHNIEKIKGFINKLEEQANDKNNWIETKVFYLKYAKAAPEKVSVENYAWVPMGIVDKLKDLLTENIEEINSTSKKLFGIVTSDERTNSITIISTKKHMREIEKIIEALDIPPRQVLIEAKIIERTITNNEAFGINWAQGFSKNINTTLAASLGDKKSGVGVQFTPGTIDGSFVGTLSSGEFRAMLEALERSQSADVLSRPNVFTMENIPAEISVIQTVPYITSTTTSDGLIKTSQEVVEVPIKLWILPQIGLNKTLQLNITVDIAKAEAAPSGSRPPVSTRNLMTRVLIADGQTIILGGIFIDNEQKDNSILPGTKSLQKIPILGDFFGKKSVDRVHTELLVFVTAKVVETPIEVTQLKEEFSKKYDEISEKKLNLNISSLTDIANYYLSIIMPEIQNKIIEKNRMTQTGFKIQKSLPEWVEDEEFAIALANAIFEYKEIFKMPYLSIDDIQRIIINYKGSLSPITKFEYLYEELSKKAELTVNINTVRVDELVKIPFISYNIAQQLLKVRNEIKYFKDINTVREILISNGVNKNYVDNYLTKIMTIGIENPVNFTYSALNEPHKKDEAVQQQQPKLNINKADINMLKNLLGLDTVDAQMIVAYRTRYGNFKTIEDLLKVPDFQNKYEKIKNYITVSD